MGFMEWIDYSLIVVFFLVTGALVVVISGSRVSGPVVEHEHPAPRREKATYVAFALLVAFVFGLALLAKRRRRGVHWPDQ